MQLQLSLQVIIREKREKVKEKQERKGSTINEQIQNIAQKKDTLCRRMYN